MILVGKYICLHAYTPINAWIHISHRYAYIGKERAFNSITQMLSSTETLANYYNRLCSSCNPQAHTLFLKHPPSAPMQPRIVAASKFCIDCLLCLEHCVRISLNRTLLSSLSCSQMLPFPRPLLGTHNALSLTSVIYLSHCIVLGFCSAPSQGFLTPSK